MTGSIKDFRRRLSIGTTRTSSDSMSTPATPAPESRRTSRSEMSGLSSRSATVIGTPTSDKARQSRLSLSSLGSKLEALAKRRSSTSSTATLTPADEEPSGPMPSTIQKGIIPGLKPSVEPDKFQGIAARTDDDAMRRKILNQEPKRSWIGRQMHKVSNLGTRAMTWENIQLKEKVVPQKRPSTDLVGMNADGKPTRLRIQYDKETIDSFLAHAPANQRSLRHFLEHSLLSGTPVKIEYSVGVGKVPEGATVHDHDTDAYGFGAHVSEHHRVLSDVLKDGKFYNFTPPEHDETFDLMVKNSLAEREDKPATSHIGAGIIGGALTSAGVATPFGVQTALAQANAVEWAKGDAIKARGGLYAQADQPIGSKLTPKFAEPKAAKGTSSGAPRPSGVAESTPSRSSTGLTAVSTTSAASASARKGSVTAPQDSLETGWATGHVKDYTTKYPGVTLEDARVMMSEACRDVNQTASGIQLRLQLASMQETEDGQEASDQDVSRVFNIPTKSIEAFHAAHIAPKSSLDDLLKTRNVFESLVESAAKGVTFNEAQGASGLSLADLKKFADEHLTTG